jgi:hypothetical protein
MSAKRTEVQRSFIALEVLYSKVATKYLRGITKVQKIKGLNNVPPTQITPRMNKPRSGGGAAAALWGVLFSEPA